MITYLPVLIGQSQLRQKNPLEGTVMNPFCEVPYYIHLKKQTFGILFVMVPMSAY
jgi:hypothetical protein